MKKNLLVSVSGGRTSAYMIKIILDKYMGKYENVCFVFANTGQEHEKTLEFVNNLQCFFGIKIHFIEAVFNSDHGKGTTHIEVDFKNMCRDGRLFEEMCKKYGLPNPDYPHCTRELKLQPINSFRKQLFARDKVDVAVGIRADEYRRCNTRDENIIYPLVDNLTTKDDVLFFWSKQIIDLGLKDYQGNCLWCWKKSDKKLYGIYKDDKKIFDVPIMLGEKYSGSGSFLADKPQRKIFRGERSAEDLIKSFSRFKYGKQKKMFSCDIGSCGESCEAYK